jgi:hypothetical protein
MPMQDDARRAQEEVVALVRRMASHPDFLRNVESAPIPGPSSVPSPDPRTLLLELRESREASGLENPDSLASFSEFYAALEETLSQVPPRGFEAMTSDANRLVLNLGDDRIVFILPSDDPARARLNSIENRALDAPPSFVEIKRSRLGGFGLFTTKECSQGELMHTERPVVRVLGLLPVKQPCLSCPICLCSWRMNETSVFTV